MTTEKWTIRGGAGKIRRRMKVEKDLFSNIEEKRLMWYGHVRGAGDRK